MRLNEAPLSRFARPSYGPGAAAAGAAASGARWSPPPPRRVV